MPQLENKDNITLSNAENQKSLVPEEVASQDDQSPGYDINRQNAQLVDKKKCESKDLDRTVEEEGNCPGDLAKNQNADDEDATQHEGRTSGDGEIQGSMISGDVMNQVKTIPDDTAMEENESLRDVPQSSSAKDNIAPSTTTPDRSNLKKKDFKPGTTYSSPYPTVYDPTGHYASAYNRILGGSTSEEEVNKPRSRPPSTSGNRQRSESTSQYSHPTTFTTSGTPHGKHKSYESCTPFPEDFRFTTFERSQTSGRSHHHELESPEFGALRRFSPSDIYTPGARPVVVGRIVTQSGKRTYNEDDDEDFGDDDRGRTFSTPSRDHITQNNPNYSRMEGEYQEAGRIQGMPATKRFRAHGADTAARKYQRREVFMEDDGDVRDRNYVPDDYYEQDSDSELFVSQNRPRNSRRPSYSSRESVRHAAAQHHDTEARRTSESHYVQRPERRARAEPEGYFNTFGQRLEPSRYSGAPMPWPVAAPPEMVDQTEVSDASLLKRNIARGAGKKICKRGYGASDPENIAIVNMKDFEHLSFDMIAQKLNEKRESEGKDPTLTGVGVNARYNRTAPLLFTAQGKEFIPLSKRKARAKATKQVPKEKNKPSEVCWTDPLDVILVNCVKDVDAAKWTTVATLFQEKTGKSVSPTAIATRYSLL